jgi:outer membrane protein TolC
MQWNIFNGGRVRSLIEVEDSRTEAALADYEQTVLVALQEVEDAIVAFERESERRGYLDRSVVAAQESVDLVLTLYRTGLTNFQNVLDMERSLFTQQDELARSEGVVVGNLVNLYRALGGGWDPDLSASPTGGLSPGGTATPTP